MRSRWRPGWRAWLGGVALLVALYAGYRGFAGIGLVTTRVVVVLAAVVAGAVLVMALLAHPGPMRTPALRAAVALAAYFVALAAWPAVGSSGYHLGGAIVAAVLAVGLYLRHRDGVGGADAVVMLAVAAGLALALAVALHALASGDALGGAGLVAAGCVGAVGYLAASVVVVGPLPDIPLPRVGEDDPVTGGNGRSREPARPAP
ncbi:hypothetical protein [Pseudonocardia xishanensis]|uniref:Uncharacterized protein n=1 Tax=Pseudonocardia xishanensis TaxID=630995 RepID=A0ABP8RYK5_9PSEU